MALYELRVYTIIVGKMNEVINLYQEEGWPALQKHAGNLVGYFPGDIGALNTLTHLWRFKHDSDRREHWKRVYADVDFMDFAAKLRPLLAAQENKLMTNAPWGPKP